MSSVELRNKTQKTVFDGTEWVFIQNADSPYLVQKISLTDLRGATGFIVGSSTRVERKYIPISSSFPWFCLSLPDQTLSTTNYSTEFIGEMRGKKITYDEMDTAVSSYSGSWSSNVFTLTDNAANNALLTALAQDWLFAGSPLSNWRILSDGVTDFNITDIDVVTREITVNLDGETTTGTSISIYLNRAYRSTTTCRHFSEAGLASYQAGSDKFNGLRRLDQMQLLQGNLPTILSVLGDGNGVFLDSARNAGAYTSYGSNSAQTLDLNFKNSNSPNARTSATTDGETIVKSSTEYKYVYTGSYTA